jgi:nucleoside-diphosphate-sugar epimerase
MLRRDNPRARIAGLSRRPVGLPFDRSIQADLGVSIPDIEGEFDLVVHAAAAVPAATAAQDEFDKVNVVGSAALFGALRLAKNCAVLNLSTSAVYNAPSVAEIDEDSAKTVDSPYGKSKLEFEELLHTRIWRPGLTILSVRIPVLLVPGVAHNFVAGWMSSIQNGEAITLFNPTGPLNAVVDDAAIYRFANMVLRQRHGGQLICNLSARDPISIREAARLVTGTIGKTVAMIEKQAPKPAQTISHRLAKRHGYEAPSTAGCLVRFVERSLNISQA